MERDSFLLKGLQNIFFGKNSCQPGCFSGEGGGGGPGWGGGPQQGRRRRQSGGGQEQQAELPERAGQAVKCLIIR